MIRTALQALLLVFALGTAQVQAQTQTNDPFPARPIRLVIPFPAGGPVDALGRQLAKSMSESLKQPVVIDNRPGASTTIGAAEVARSAPDGYTALFTLADSFTYVHQLFKTLPYDPLKDFAQISQVASSAPVLIARSELAPSPLRQLLAPSPAKPISFGTWGPGSYPHLIAASLIQQTGSNMIVVPYKGGAPVVQDFMGGFVQLAVVSVSQARDLQQKGMARIVAVAGDKRLPQLPDVPTYAEQGFTDPMFAMTTWAGLAAPAMTPTPIVMKLREAMLTALRAAETQKFLYDNGWAAVGSTPAEVRVAMEREMPVIANVMRLAGVQPQ